LNESRGARVPPGWSLKQLLIEGISCESQTGERCSHRVDVPPLLIGKPEHYPARSRIKRTAHLTINSRLMPLRK
jgi:hypothetical protein